MKRLSASVVSSGAVLADRTSAMSVGSKATSTRSGALPTFPGPKRDGVPSRLGLLVLDHVTGHRFDRKRCLRCGAVEHWAD